MNDKIVKICNDLCESRDSKLIFLCESGSRSWGYASKNSDYDVRGIYIKNKMDYIYSFFYEHNNDIINRVIKDEESQHDLDIELWDVKKVINLYFRSGNQMPVWWVTSDIIYFENDKGQLLKQFLIHKNENNLSKLIYHYFGIIMQKFKDDKYYIKIKNLIHIFRSIMCINYAIEKRTFPSQNMKVLLSVNKDERIEKILNQLLKLKIEENKQIMETGVEDIVELINEYIKKIKLILTEMPKPIKNEFDESWKNIINLFLF